MLTREMIMDELTKKGYEVSAFDKVKNGVLMNGIMCRRGNISPVFYVNELIENENMELDEAVKIVESVLRTETPNLNIEEITSPDYILNNVYMGLQRVSAEEILKKKTEFKGIECYLYVRVEEGIFKLLTTTIKILGISELELWRKAKENTEKETDIISLSEAMKELGMEVQGLNEYVVSNKDRRLGASGILMKDKIKQFANELGVDSFVMLPSSIHEVILLPINKGDVVDLEFYNMMVSEVNESEVLPEERLTDRAYLIEI
ncbi:MAG: DUF5688 family protein [Acutalibacteraceae bacterium]|nr:DUF5688 family protein [Acutalibacteraceae bacterium]